MRTIISCCLCLAFIGLFSASCADEQCECAKTGLTIFANPDQVQSVQTSGPACASATIRCSGPDSTNRPGCTAYYIQPSAEGECVVDVEPAEGDIESLTVTFGETVGECCSGFYADVPEWDLTE